MLHKTPQEVAQRARERREARALPAPRTREARLLEEEESPAALPAAKRARGRSAIDILIDEPSAAQPVKAKTLPEEQTESGLFQPRAEAEALLPPRRGRPDAGRCCAPAGGARAHTNPRPRRRRQRSRPQPDPPRRGRTRPRMCSPPPRRSAAPSRTSWQSRRTNTAIRPSRCSTRTTRRTTPRWARSCAATRAALPRRSRASAWMRRRARSSTARASRAMSSRSIRV